ncbi:class I SAM-dependent methyltransferase [Listeria ivanovii]|uniref:class I SAM-dependent methyltransferase n=1 Tax=Listeria ivanovii TaxID=1638 RepID=UPI00051288A6|nr:class I SAM-dependent methyltransferase [Listeria ivanovii]AIS61726.1 SAM-dependent methyltransferase [Listeria ivanovii subsp. londoniensis]MBK1965830.1 methyltransferase domain-containing protein [Listeria ivanovii subsp. londoniensis]MBK1984823.1 methyltransferase domain-containing protein [Listeria ivanovii subsp. londoniensis]MBK1995536.1 methyltransferase domain-containing protein [Listeria ivanovii subsp. londoniensis]
MNLDEIVDCMLLTNQEIQQTQTDHRMKLVDFWEIKSGDRVLEVGCGQGDTTAVLANAVGSNGFVQGIDIAPKSYGAPFTLGDATDHLKKSPLGNRMDFKLATNILQGDITFSDLEFDVAVLSHASWYFSSKEELTRMLILLSKWANRVCYAEWDPQITDVKQSSHLLAVLTQASYEAFKKETQSNIRTFISPFDLKEIIAEHHWKIGEEASIYSEKMQDSRWEIEYTKNFIAKELEADLGVPDKFKSFLLSQTKLIHLENSLPMASYCTSWQVG